jgi:hypothetical protein
MGRESSKDDERLEARSKGLYDRRRVGKERRDKKALGALSAERRGSEEAKAVKMLHGESIHFVCDNIPTTSFCHFRAGF